jgi:hypothetical protein
VNLEQIADALHAFGTVTYGRATQEPDASALNTALDNALAAIKRLRFGSLWPMRTAQAMARSLGALGG